MTDTSQVDRFAILSVERQPFSDEHVLGAEVQPDGTTALRLNLVNKRFANILGKHA